MMRRLWDALALAGVFVLVPVLVFGMIGRRLLEALVGREPERVPPPPRKAECNHEHIEVLPSRMKSWQRKSWQYALDAMLRGPWVCKDCGVRIARDGTARRV